MSPSQSLRSISIKLMGKNCGTFKPDAVRHYRLYGIWHRYDPDNRVYKNCEIAARLPDVLKIRKPPIQLNYARQPIC